MKFNTNCTVAADLTDTAEGKTSDPSGTNQETSAVAAMQNSPTAKSKKNSLWAFLGNIMKIGHRGSKVSPLQPVSDTDSADPQPGPSGLEPTALQDQTDSQPGPSSIKPVNCDANPADPEPAEEKQAKSKKNRLWAFLENTFLAVKNGLRGNKVSSHQPVSDTDSSDPQPGPSSIKPVNCDANPADPGPAEGVLEKQNKIKKKGIHKFFKRLWCTVKDPAVNEPMALQDPTEDPGVIEPMALQDPTEDPAVNEPMALQDPSEDPAVNEPMALQDPTEDPGVNEPMALQDPTEDPAVIEPMALQDPTEDPGVNEPMALQDPTEDPAVNEPMALQDPTEDPAASMITPDVGPCGLVLTGLQDPADPLPGPSNPVPRLTKFTIVSKRRRVGDQTWFRTTSSPGPSTLPFSEVYEVEEEIGEGGFGTVYEGILKFTREQVAIKIISKSVLNDRYISIPGCPKPLLAEVALNLLLNQPPVSPYIVHMLDWFEEEDRYILILELPQPCKDLQRFVVSNILRMNESMASDLMYQAVLGAKHCLDRGVLHRDIKLNNFLINTTTNQVKMIDFGCGDLIKSSYFGDFSGACRPPEYYNCLKYEAGPTTVWSLGIMMYRIICRHHPFKNLEDMNHGNLTFNSRISRDGQDLISRCLTCDPTKRATIKEILQHEWFQRGKMSRVAQELGSVP